MENSPKVFISYSWSSIPHREWVKDLATHLVENGIDVLLDIWDLDLGHDTNYFMERIKQDKDITKTLIISDRSYVEKANSRRGGVGAETQIISKDVYDKIGENRFIAVIAERDEENNPYVPTFYTSRMYVDLSTNDAYSENLEVLVRAIYGEPLHRKPKLGKKPAFLDKATNSAASSPLLYNRATAFFKEGKPQAIPAIKEYFTDCISRFESYRITPDNEVFFDDQVIESIQNFLPYRNEILQLIQTAFAYAPPNEITREIHVFFEKLIPYTTRPIDVSSSKESDYDNFVFFIKELFLSTVALLLKEKKFSVLNEFLSQDFYFKNDARSLSSLHDFSILYGHCRSIAYRNQRLELSRISLEADLLKERAFGSPVNFDELMQADFVLLIRARLSGISFWPDTLVYLDHFPRPFEVFARSASKSYFLSFKPVLGIESKDELEILVGTPSIPTSFRDPLRNSRGLLNLEELCTRP